MSEPLHVAAAVPAPPAPVAAGGNVERHPPAAAVLGAAAVGGLAVMTVELAAVRLLAPWFGASQTVWTNVIGVVLLALALGYLAGARLASGPRPAHRLGLLLATGGAWVAWMPALARAVGDALVPAELALEDAAGLVATGSLAASLLLFLLPATLLGAAGPLAVEALQRRRGGTAGAAGGHVLAASTLASLVGAFGTGHVALPRLGLERTFWAAALLLLVTGAALAIATRRRTGARALAALVVALGVAAAASEGVGPPRLAPDRRVLEVAESPYQRVLAVEEGEGDARLRYLQVNEALDSFQSVWRPEPGLLGEGFYYDDFALPAHWAAREGRSDATWRTLVVGLGAGSVWRVLDGALPEGVQASGAGVELDPVVVELGRRWFDLPEEGHARWRVLALDGRLGLRVARGPFELVVLDSYANQHELPPHLVTREFFREVHAVLESGGYAALNLGAFDLDDPLVPVVGATLAAAFDGRVLALAVPLARNVTLFARKDGSPPEPGTSAFVPEHAALAARAHKAALPGAWRWIDADDAEPLTDEHAPLEPLQRASLAHGRARRAELP